jgi:hypothetical protein
MARGFFIVFLAIFGCIVGLNPNAFACSPLAKNPTLTDHINDADAIFTGRISTVSDYEIAVKVTVIYKGLVRKNVFVNIPSSSSLCGIDNMKPGQRIVVYGQTASPRGKTSQKEKGIHFRSSHVEGTHVGTLTSAERRRLRKGAHPK